jgi:hypothetical protein
LEGPGCLLSTGAPNCPVHTGHCTLQRLQIADWLVSASGGIGPPGGWNWTVRCTCWSLAPADVSTSHLPTGTSDCGVNYSRRSLVFPRATLSVGPCTRLSGGWHRTVRCYTDHSKFLFSFQFSFAPFDLTSYSP